MSLRFSFLITIDSKGTPSAKIYKKENAQDGLNDFSKAREQGKEAYWFHSPKEDKRCKSEVARQEQADAVTGISKEVTEEIKVVESTGTTNKQPKFASGLTDLD